MNGTLVGGPVDCTASNDRQSLAIKGLIIDEELHVTDALQQIPAETICP